MRRAVSIVLVTVVTLAIGAAAWADCVDGQPNARARMKCCAAAHHKCGTRGNPDDCCKHMQGAGPIAAVAAVGVPIIKAPVVHGTVERFAERGTIALSRYIAFASPEFKRPHDPPHLHPFALLI